MDIVEVLQNLTDDQKSRYMKLERLFESEGWKILKEWFESQVVETQNRAIFASTWDENRVAVGQMSVYSQISGLSESLEAEFRQLAQQNVEAISEREFVDEVNFE